MLERVLFLSHSKVGDHGDYSWSKGFNFCHVLEL